MTRYRLGSLVALATLGFVACKGKSNDNPPPPPPAATTSGAPSISTAAVTPPPTTSVSTGGAVASAAPRPRYLRRLKPETMQASSIYDDKKSHEKHPAVDAFDGDYKTAWTEGVDGDGAGEWLEGSFSAPKKIWGIAADTGIVRTKPGADLFTLNAHAKKLRLRLDDADVSARDVAADETSIAWDGLDRDAKSVRVIADATYPGTKWHDFGITELSILVDATTFPTVPESMVQGEVDDANTAASTEGAAKILRRFGVNPPQSQLDGRTAVVTLQKASLVDGADKERILVVSLRGQPDESGMRDEDVWIEILGTVGDRLLGLGSDWISTKTKDGAPVTIDTSKLHTFDVWDVVATWSSCTDTVTKSCQGLRAWSAQRGFVQRIVDLTSDDVPSISEGEAPKKITATGLALAFDGKVFVYR